MASNTKRSPKQIEADFLRIKEAAKTSTSWADIERITNLSRTQILTSLEKHRVTHNRIKEQLINNKAITDAVNAKVKAEKNKKEITTSEEVKEQVASPLAPSDSTSSQSVKSYVIDASMAATVKLKELLENICSNDGKIILTSITLKELERLQPLHDVTGIDARYILSLAVNKPDNFEPVLIDETVGSPSECIIHYCKKHKHNVILLTGNKTMYLKAQMYSIDVQRFDKVWETTNNHAQEQSKTSSSDSHLNQGAKNFEIQPISKNSNENTPVTTTPIRYSPFNAGKDSNNRLVIKEFYTPTKSICVHSRGEQYFKGPYQLRVGDSVFVATLEQNNVIDFKVYNIVSTSSVDNYKQHFHKKFYPDKRIYLSDGRYRAFVYAFKKRFNL